MVIHGSTSVSKSRTVTSVPFVHEDLPAPTTISVYDDSSVYSSPEMIRATYISVSPMVTVILFGDTTFLPHFRVSLSDLLNTLPPFFFFSPLRFYKYVPTALYPPSGLPNTVIPPSSSEGSYLPKSRPHSRRESFWLRLSSSLGGSW